MLMKEYCTVADKQETTMGQMALKLIGDEFVHTTVSDEFVSSIFFKLYSSFLSNAAFCFSGVKSIGATS
jgi:hypothetical protein